MVKCDVIQDLLPLYIDDVASEGSRAEVDKHIAACPDCWEVLSRMQSGVKPIPLSVDKAEIGAFKIMKKKLLRKNFLIACASVIVTIALIYGVFGYYMPLPYDPNKMSVNLAYDQVIDIYYDGNYTGATARQVDDAVYIGYDGTLFTRLFYNGEKRQFSIGTHIMADYGGRGKAIELTENSMGNTVEVETDTGKAQIHHPINKIYYLDYRKINLGDPAFEQAKKEAVLIWERPQK